VIFKITKLAILVATVFAASGCQLLIDNRSRGSSAVVVVPTSEWDAMRQASIDAEQLKAKLQSADMTGPAQTAEIEPAPGSEAIRFTNYTGASLGGCTTLGIIEVQHKGNIDDAFTVLKNEAFRLSSNSLITTHISSEHTSNYDTIQIEARMLTCPIKLARGN